MQNNGWVMLNLMCVVGQGVVVLSGGIKCNGLHGMVFSSEQMEACN